MRRYQTEGSRRLHQQTVPYLLDGVGSSFHVSSYRDYPVAMTHGKGSKLYDVDGNEYIDYVLGFGPMLLGYCPPAVDRAVAEQLRRGSHFSAPTEDLKRLSQRLVEIIPSAELVAYQNSGTEVVMYALRLARAYTGKYKIVKFEGQYHGWSDEKVSIDASCVEELGDRRTPQDPPYQGTAAVLRRGPDRPALERPAGAGAHPGRPRRGDRGGAHGALYV
ncbi:MAG: aminotransferase class III-fold pyridoxal phosphate-dependent enzyme [Evtepia gabavorous]